ncbi:hypothetical protein KGQ20_04395 [Catenulispora sp. NF23]|uniref:hypothetical protein n=1 Tax=Catenulispora pinistramenti TaxID=2705254 RepID=UPI001BA4D389|nr:hypothetical protein [Catenulispora pinistramenti]MBS2532002.1 hypothetical protein [Catenulispora pinistramenti]
MTGNPDDDLRALRQMLPVPPDRDFLPGRRHLREEHLMTSWTSMNRRNQPRRLAVRVATSVAISAAAVGAFAAVATHESHSAAGHAVATSTTPGDDTVAGDQISTVAYSLTKVIGDNSVHIVFHASAAVNPAEFQADLAKLGVEATVTAISPDQVKNVKIHIGDAISVAFRQSNGDYSTSVANGQLDLLGFGTGDPMHHDFLVITPVHPVPNPIIPTDTAPISMYAGH